MKIPWNVALRFMVKVRKTDGCWIWEGCTKETGRGSFNFGGTIYNTSVFSYPIHKGEIPHKQLVRHTCDNPQCVNPDHLILGTHQDNSDDAVERGLTAKGGKNGMSKLNITDVREIRELISRYHFSNSLIGSFYGVKEEAIRRIKVGDRWGASS